MILESSFCHISLPSEHCDLHQLNYKYNLDLHQYKICVRAIFKLDTQVLHMLLRQVRRSLKLKAKNGCYPIHIKLNKNPLNSILIKDIIK